VRLKECPHCKETLFCKNCGERFTPQKEDKKTESLLLKMTTEQKAKLERLAERKGVSMSAVLRLAFESVLDSKSTSIDDCIDALYEE